MCSKGPKLSHLPKDFAYLTAPCPSHSAVFTDPPQECYSKNESFPYIVSNLWFMENPYFYQLLKKKWLWKPPYLNIFFSNFSYSVETLSFFKSSNICSSCKIHV